MILSLGSWKVKAFIGAALLLSFMAFTYKVYDVGYDSAVSKLSLEAYEAKRVHDKQIGNLRKELTSMERLYLEEKEKEQVEFERKYKGAMKEVVKYVKVNNYSDCNIGTDGVQSINELLKGNSSNDK